MGSGNYVWEVTVVVILAAWGMQVVNIRAMQSAWGQLEGELAGAEDLWLVRRAINTSMMLAVLYLGMSMAFFLFLIWAWFGAGMGMMALTGPVFVFGILTLPAGYIGKQYENKIRRLDTGSCGEEVLKTYSAWLNLWGKARFRLPDE